MNAQTPITAAVPKAIRDGLFQLDDILGTAWDAAQVVDYLNEKGLSDLAYKASHPLLADLMRAREILHSIWGEAMGKEVSA